MAPADSSLPAPFPGDGQSSTGITSSLAGSARRKLRSAAPFIPNRSPGGFKKSARCSSRLRPPHPRLLHSQRSRPAGAATATARPPQTGSGPGATEQSPDPRGRRKGGSSRIKALLSPFKTVRFKSHEAAMDAPAPRAMSPVMRRPW